MMLILAIRSAMLTYFGAVVKLPMQDRFDAGSLRDSAALDSTALAVPQVLCCTRRPKAAQASKRSGADHIRSAVSVQNPSRPSAARWNNDAMEAMPWQCPSTNGLILSGS